MSTKKLKINEETKIIEVIEEETQVINPKNRRERISFVISILSFIISVGALGISYSQKVTNEKQVDVSVRQFDLDKKPIFECYIEQEELYNDDDYWGIYRSWLYDNEISSFDDWYNQKFPESTISSIIGKKRFWNAYDNYDTTILAELTEGEFEIYENEYRQYLSSKNYTSYNKWKAFPYVFKKDHITLKNTGSYITNATLYVYTYINYQLHIGDNISYSFVIDMGDYVFNEAWLGEYFSTMNYDSGNSSFSIEYTQDTQPYKDEQLKLAELLDFLTSNDIIDEIGLDTNNTNVYYVILRPVYFCINYLDSEQEKQTDWYEYYIESNTLYYRKTYESDVKVPDFTKEGFTDAYYEAESLRRAEILGYQNAQWRPFFAYEDFSYIEKAKQKIIADLRELVSNI